jgi:hypothetical protein
VAIFPLLLMIHFAAVVSSQQWFSRLHMNTSSLKAEYYWPLIMDDCNLKQGVPDFIYLFLCWSAFEVEWREKR